MTLSAGTKLKSAVCTAEGIVIRPPDVEGILCCGAAAVLLAGEAPTPDIECLILAEAGAALVGKRYVDLDTGLEVLCTKGGKGSLAIDGGAMTVKQAKALPSSD